MKPARAIALAAALAFAVAGCGGGDSGSSEAREDGQVVAVKLTDDGCEPAELSLASGPVTFEVENDGAEEVSEFEILDGDRILGEAENLAPGLSGRFSLTLAPGSYTSYCPGGESAERGELTVTEAAK